MRITVPEVSENADNHTGSDRKQEQHYRKCLEMRITVTEVTENVDNHTGSDSAWKRA